MDNIIAEYVAAYAALHGAAPVVVQQGKRYHVTNHRGATFDYSAREMGALIAGLERLAKR